MPCDSIQLAQVHLGLCNQDILRSTLVSIADSGSVQPFQRRGWVFRVDGSRYLINEAGDLVCAQGNEGMADRVKREYSKKTIQAGAKKFGWSVSAKTPMKLTVRR